MWSITDTAGDVVLSDQGYGLGVEGPLMRQFWEWKDTREGPVAITPTGPTIEPFDADHVGDYLLARVFLEDVGVDVSTYVAPAGVDEVMGSHSPDAIY